MKMRKHVKTMMLTAALVAVCAVRTVLGSDLGFAKPVEDWRTRMQISTNETPDTAYAPISVFAPREHLLEVSFGWTNFSGSAVTEIPPVRFRLYKPGVPSDVCIADWTATAPISPESVAFPLGAHAGGWGGRWNCDVLKVLKPGDYMLEAEIAPENNSAPESDRKAIFRFAVRDPAVDAAQSVFTEEAGWMNVESRHGNDFAQPPHAAVRLGADGTNLTTVQFGPYVPMNGINGRTGGSKKALDLVFLIDYSGSQSASISGLINNIGDFMEQLFVGDPANGVEPISDLRIKVAGFSDYRSDRTWYEWFYEGAFTTDRSALKKDLTYMKTLCTNYGGGGYNGGESSYDALYYICKGWMPNKPVSPTGYLSTQSEFRGTNEAARAVILITDEPPHLPLDADGCKNLEASDLAAALNAASINLMIVGDGEYRQRESNRDFYNNRLRHKEFCDAYPDICELIETGGRGTLPQFTGDANKLRALANNVSSKVAFEANVVEPEFTASVRGGGTLRFNWKNDSTAGTNNTFTFTCEGVTNIVKEAGAGWGAPVELSLGEGVHLFKWSYGKLGYDGDLTDCGILANATWEPWHTTLEVDPEHVVVDWKGVPAEQATEQSEGLDQTNDVSLVEIKVECNSIWRVVDYPTNWMTVVQGAGNGDGEAVFTVHTNKSYVARTGTITIRAGEYGLPSDHVLGMPERVVMIEQQPVPFAPGPLEVHTVDVKPRWPWNGKVDIDFIVVVPEDTDGATITFEGRDGQGYEYWSASQKSGEDLKKFFVYDMPSGLNADSDWWLEERSEDSSESLAEFHCTTTGIYRITWNVAEDWWGPNATGGLWPSQNTFHTPLFSILLKAQAGSSYAEKESNTVRVDTRMEDKGEVGGRLGTGIERVGHPQGVVDPVPWNTAIDAFGEVAYDGGYTPDFVFTNEYRTASMSNTTVCVLNDTAYVEGGTLTSNTVWRADKVHVVRDNVYIPEQYTLTIEDGAVVKFCGHTRIFVCYRKNTLDWNITMKGVYVEDVDNKSDDFGGDTLFHCGSDVVSLNKSDCFWDYDFPDNDKGQLMNVQQVGGIYTVVMKTVETNEASLADHVYSSTWERLYTRNQPYGNLPLPVYAGEDFYGWFPYSPWGDTSQHGDLDKEKAWYYSVRNEIIQHDWIVRDVKPVWHEDEGKYKPTENAYDTISGLDLYAYSNTAGRHPVNYCSKIYGGDNKATVVLSDTVFTYSGTNMQPYVKSVHINTALVVPENYDVINAGGTDVGDYSVTVSFKNFYSGVATAGYVIKPRPTTGGQITFFTNGVPCVAAMYEPGLALPAVTVSLPGMDFIPSGECTGGWLDANGRWPRPGRYVYVASFASSGNYVGGSITNYFYVEPNPAYIYQEYDTEADALVQSAGTKRLLYIGGRTNDVMTEYVKALIADDLDLNNFVIENFVCWADDVDKGGSKYATYSAGLSTTALPLLAVVSTNDTSRYLDRHAGYITATDLRTFLENALTLPDQAQILFDPTSNSGSVEVSNAKSADDATNQVVIAIPPMNGSSSTPSGSIKAYLLAQGRAADDAAATAQYQTYFVKKAEYDTTKNVWVVTVELNPAVVLPEEEISGKTVTAESKVLSAVLDGSDATIRTVPGLYYRLLGSASVTTGYDGYDAVLADGEELTLTPPPISGNSAFFKVTVDTEPNKK